MKKYISILAAAAVLVGLCGCGESVYQPSGSVMPEGSKNVAYAGAILPLTTREPREGLSVQRSLNLDFSQWDAEEGVAEVRDDYILINTDDASIDLMLYYPIASSLKEWREESCNVDVNQLPTEYEVYYARPDSNESERFEIYDDRYDDPNDIGDSLMGYMEHTYCLERAFEPMADLSQIMGCRYRIVDVQYDSIWPMPEEASLCLEYNWEAWQGMLRGYGFTRSGSYTVIPGEVLQRQMVLVKDLENVFLMSVNGKLTDYSLDGFSTIWCEEGTELPKLTARLEVEEMPLSQIMEEAVAHYIEHEQVKVDKQLFSKEAFNRIADDLSSASGGYGYNSLGYYLNMTPDQERIFWLEIPVTIDAGEKISVSVRHQRTGGAEIGGPAAREGIWHYDILPNYGTNLDVLNQRISVVGHDNINITKESPGRRLIEGLVPEEEFYHFAVEAN